MLIKSSSFKNVHKNSSHENKFNDNVVLVPLYVKRGRTVSHRGPSPVEVVGVGEAGAADGAVGQSVLRVDEKVSSQ